MKKATATYYGRMADRVNFTFDHDPVQGPDTNGRATVANGRGLKFYQRFHPTEEQVWVNDIDGRPRWLTRLQVSVLQLALAIADQGGTSTMRSMAASLAISPSTVSRTMVKCQAFGLLTFMAGRGRHSGLLIVRRLKGDGLERFRELAKAKLRAWAKARSDAAQERVSRLIFNVASYVHGRGEDSLTSYFRDNSKESATLIAQPWTVEELRAAGIV